MLQKFIDMTLMQYASGDFDADHPTCMWLINKYGLDSKQALWLTLLTMAFYNEVSAWIAFNNSDTFTLPRVTNLPIDKNRRNLYGPGIVRHLEHLCSSHKASKNWPRQDFGRSKITNWKKLKNNIGQIWGNGRFATYNTADMLHKVNHFPVLITGFDNKASSGPAHGISVIMDCDRKDIKALDRAGEELFQIVEQLGKHPTYVKSDRGTVESVLCNFSGTYRGKYYPGRNIDRQQDRILAITKDYPQYKKLVDCFWEARQEIFDKKYLGEFNGWVGVDSARKKHFQTTGELLRPNEGRQ